MAKKATGTALVNWEAEMEAKAKIAEAAQRKTGGGGAFFSTAGGVLKYGGTAMPGNQMAVIILADIMENVYYDAPYDPEVPASPKCFAFGKSEREMQPHEAVALEDCFEQQADTCSECPHNEWGSAAKGKGKACSNGMRLAMIPAGVYSAKGRGREVSFSLDKLFEDEAHFKSAETAFFKVPVTSVKNYADYVRSLSTTLKYPPFAVYTNIWLERHERFQHTVNFEAIGKCPTELLPLLTQRADAAAQDIGFPYSPPVAREEVKHNPKISRGAKPVKSARLK